ncbi:MAG: hypothetical protein U1E65_14575 [Myxococcota bacterium]
MTDLLRKPRPLPKLLLALGLALAPLSLPAFADGTSTTAATPTIKPPPGFEPVPGGAERAEKVSANLMVVLAYAGFFAGIFGYVILVARRQAELGRDIQALADRISRKP